MFGRFLSLMVRFFGIGLRICIGGDQGSSQDFQSVPHLTSKIRYGCMEGILNKWIRDFSCMKS